MTDIDLDAIRERDANWTDNGCDTNQNATGCDRRLLLQYIDSLHILCEDIVDDLAAIKRVHRDGYQAKAAPVAEPEAESSGNAGKGLRDFRASQTSGKLDP